MMPELFEQLRAEVDALSDDDVAAYDLFAEMLEPMLSGTEVDITPEMAREASGLLTAMTVLQGSGLSVETILGFTVVWLVRRGSEGNSSLQIADLFGDDTPGGIDDEVLDSLREQWVDLGDEFAEAADRLGPQLRAAASHIGPGAPRTKREFEVALTTLLLVAGFGRQLGIEQDQATTVVAGWLQEGLRVATEMDPGAR